MRKQSIAGLLSKAGEGGYPSLGLGAATGATHATVAFFVLNIRSTQINPQVGISCHVTIDTISIYDVTRGCLSSPCLKQ